MEETPYKSAKEEAGCVPHLAMKEHPCHVTITLMPLKPIIGQTTYNGAASGFEVKSQQHS